MDVINLVSDDDCEDGIPEGESSADIVYIDDENNQRIWFGHDFVGQNDIDDESDEEISLIDLCSFDNMVIPQRNTVATSVNIPELRTLPQKSKRTTQTPLPKSKSKQSKKEQFQKSREQEREKLNPFKDTPTPLLFPSFSYERPRGFECSHGKKKSLSKSNRGQNKEDEENQEDYHASSERSISQGVSLDKASSDSNIPLCNHGDPCLIRHTVKPGPNKGRKFYTCASFLKDPSLSCGFFEWVDKDDENIDVQENHSSKKQKTTSNTRKKTRINYYASTDNQTSVPLDLIEVGGEGMSTLVWEGAASSTFG